MSWRLREASKQRRMDSVTPTPLACGRDIPWRRGEAACYGLPRVRVEMPAPPVLGKEPIHRKYADFRLEPDSMCESVFLFSGKPMTLHNKFGLQITDLRISVTDRCNFRCVYCRS